MQRRRFNALLAGLPLWPLAARSADPTWTDDAWLDPARNRSLPVRVRWPVGDAPCGLILFSHGLGGNREAGTVWAQAWQQAGFAVVNLQHPGSDSSIWADRLRGVRQATQPTEYLARVADARFALHELERRRDRGGDPGRRVRLAAIGFSGHSYGARLTQALAGERPARAGAGLKGLADGMPEPRLRAFIAFSPGFNARDDSALDEAPRRFGAITRPFLCVTGTRDDAMIVGDATNAARRAVYPALPPGAKAELLLAGADHMTFGGQDLPGSSRRGPLARAPGATELQPAHHAVVATITTDWWRWRLLGDAQAAQRLVDPAGLAALDRWTQG